jgi:hypothetical protein
MYLAASGWMCGMSEDPPRMQRGRAVTNPPTCFWGRRRRRDDGCGASAVEREGGVGERLWGEGDKRKLEAVDDSRRRRRETTAAAPQSGRGIAPRCMKSLEFSPRACLADPGERGS